MGKQPALEYFCFIISDIFVIPFLYRWKHTSSACFYWKYPCTQVVQRLPYWIYFCRPWSDLTQTRQKWWHIMRYVALSRLILGGGKNARQSWLTLGLGRRQKEAAWSCGQGAYMPPRLPLSAHGCSAALLGHNHVDGLALTHWDQGKLDTISQTTHQMHFRVWKLLYFDSNFTEVCSLWSNWQKSSIGSGNSLAKNRRQANRRQAITLNCQIQVVGHIRI